MCQEILRTEILRRCALQTSHNDIFLALRCQLIDEVDPDAPHAKRKEQITITKNNERVGQKKTDILKREIGNVAVSLCELGSLHDKHAHIVFVVVEVCQGGTPSLAPRVKLYASLLRAHKD